MARGILGIVVLFVVAMVVVLVVKSRSVRVESAGPAPSSADLQIKEVDLEEEAKGVRWRLKAEQASMYEQTGQTQLRKIMANIHQRERVWTVVGEGGQLDRATNNVEVRGNVVVTSNDGLRLETDVLRWDAAAKRLWTDSPVVLSRAGSVVRGSGLDVRLSEEATTIAGPVRAVFEPGRRQ